MTTRANENHHCLYCGDKVDGNNRLREGRLIEKCLKYGAPIFIFSVCILTGSKFFGFYSTELEYTILIFLMVYTTIVGGNMILYMIKGFNL